VLNTALKTGIKGKALSVSKKLEIIKNVDVQPHVTHTVKQFRTPVSTLNNTVKNKKDQLQQCASFPRDQAL
jgi:hypothetical protein